MAFLTIAVTMGRVQSHTCSSRASFRLNTFLQSGLAHLKLLHRSEWVERSAEANHERHRLHSLEFGTLLASQLAQIDHEQPSRMHASRVPIAGGALDWERIADHA